MGTGLSLDIVRGPVGRLLALAVWMTMFSMFVGGINQWYLQTADACVVQGERLDRVVVAGSNDVEDAWQGVTSTFAPSSAVATLADLSPTVAYIVAENAATSGGCVILSNMATPAAQTFVSSNVGAYTPTGTEVQVSGTAGTNPTIDGGKWSESSSALQAGGLGTMIGVLLQAGGLAPPVFLLMTLGGMALSFIRNTGANPIMAAVIVGIIILLFSTILNTLMPFLTDAYEALEPMRYAMYASGIGSLATVIGNFFGVSLIAGGIMVAWHLFQGMRGQAGGDALRGGKGKGRM